MIPVNEHASGSDDGHASMFGPGIAGDVRWRELRLDLTDQVDGPDGSGASAVRFHGHGEFLHPGKLTHILNQHAGFLACIQAKHPGTDRFVIDGPELIHLCRLGALVS